MDKLKLDGVGFPSGLKFTPTKKTQEGGGNKSLKIINRGVKTIHLKFLQK